MAENATQGAMRRYILVQLPEKLEPDNTKQKVACDFLQEIGKPLSISEITKERLRRAAKRVSEDHTSYEGDLGFRVFKLDTSNIRAWETAPDDIKAALFNNIDHIKEDRSEQDILYELLLKFGLDLCVPVESLTIAGKIVYAVGAGALIACLDEKITRADVEPLALGIADFHKQVAPAGEATVLFRDSAFADDVAKTNVAAILEQHELGTVRSV